MSKDLMMTCRSEVKELVERAKQKDPKSDGLNLGEKFFVELLHFYIGQYRINRLTEDELKTKKKLLERDLMNYWDLQRIFKQDCEIRNRQSQWFIKAEKEGCISPIKNSNQLFTNRTALFFSLDKPLTLSIPNLAVLLKNPLPIPVVHQIPFKQLFLRFKLVLC